MREKQHTRPLVEQHGGLHLPRHTEVPQPGHRTQGQFKSSSSLHRAVTKPRHSAGSGQLIKRPAANSEPQRCVPPASSKPDHCSLRLPFTFLPTQAHTTVPFLSHLQLCLTPCHRAPSVRCPSGSCCPKNCAQADKCRLERHRGVSYSSPNSNYALQLFGMQPIHKLLWPTTSCRLVLGKLKSCLWGWLWAGSERRLQQNAGNCGEGTLPGLTFAKGYKL